MAELPFLRLGSRQSVNGKAIFIQPGLGAIQSNQPGLGASDSNEAAGSAQSKEVAEATTPFERQTSDASTTPFERQTSDASSKISDSLPDLLPTLVKQTSDGSSRASLEDAQQSSKRGSLKFSIRDLQEEVYCVRFSPDDSYLAVSFGNGTCSINNTVTGRHSHFLGAKKGNELLMPMTCVRWRPQPARSRADMMVSVSSDGCVSLWHVSARKRLAEATEPGNQLFCVDYAADCATLATAGKEPVVRVYDEPTMKVVQTLTGGDMITNGGHSNRIFSLKYHPTHPNIIVTGSWDQKVQFWDTRIGFAVRALWGPLISGDAMDISGDGEMILTGSCRRDNQLQLWDWKTSKLIKTIPWCTDTGEMSPTRLYTAQFSKHRTCATKQGSMMLAAGGGNPDEMKLFDLTLSVEQVVHRVSDMSKGCYTIDFSGDSDMLAVGSGDGKVHVIAIDHRGDHKTSKKIEPFSIKKPTTPRKSKAGKGFTRQRS